MKEVVIKRVFYNLFLPSVNSVMRFCRSDSKYQLFQGAEMQAILKEYEALELPVSLNIKNINLVRDTIFNKILDGNSLSIVVPNNAEIDIVFIQMMESLRVFAGSRNLKIKLENPVNAACESVLKRGGFQDSFSDDDNEFWFNARTAR